MKVITGIIAGVLTSIASLSASPISISSGNFEVGAGYSGSINGTYSDYGSVTPFSGMVTDDQTLSASIMQSYSSDQFTIIDNSNDFLFRVDMNQQHSATQWSLARDGGKFAFSTSADMTFSVTGNYTTTSTGQRFIYQAQLYDLTTAQYVYSSKQDVWDWSRNITPSLSLGGTAGNYSNTILVPQDYVLSANHQYQISYGTWFQGDPTASLAQASGFFQFSAASISENGQNNVPEPGTLALFISGVLFLVSLSSRKLRV